MSLAKALGITQDGFHVWKGVTTSCSLRCVNTQRLWEENSPSSLNFATVSLSFYPELLSKRLNREKLPRN